MSRSMRWCLPGLMLSLTLVAACEPEPESPGSATRLAPPECEAAGFPCTWNEVDASVVLETDYLGEVAGLLGHGGASQAEVTDFLLKQPNVEVAAANGTGIRYRLAGGRPAWIFIEDELAHHRGRLEPALGDTVEVAPPVPEDRSPSGATLTGRSVPGTLASRIVNLTEHWIGPAPLHAAVQVTESAQGVAAEEPGTGKRALILSPFEHEFPGTGAGLSARAGVIRDYRRENGGEMVYHADLDERDGNPVGPTLSNRLPSGGLAPSGDVQFEDFLVWDTYNLVVLASHGTQHECLQIPPIGGGAPGPDQNLSPIDSTLVTEFCPLIWAGRAKQESYGNHMGVEIIAFTGFDYLPHPGLSPTEADWCVQQLAAREAARRHGGTVPPESLTEGGKHCRLPSESRELRRLALWTSFFDNEYPDGLNNVMVMLAACRSGTNNYLLDILAPEGNRNVVVMGFDDTVDAGLAFAVANEFLEQVDNGLHSDALLSKLREVDGTGHLVGVALDLGDEPLPAEPAELVDAASTVTYGRDIVLLVNPATGEELRDGGTIGIRSSEDGTGNSELLVFPRILGVTESARLPQIRLQVGIEGSGPSNAGYSPARRVEGAAYQFEGPVALGRAAESGERVDLEIRTQLPGGQLSRWVYEDIQLVGCYWSATLSGRINANVEGAMVEADNWFGMLSTIQMSGGNDGSDPVSVRIEIPGVIEARSYALGTSGPTDGGIRVGTSLTPGTYGRARDGRLEMTAVRPGERLAGTFSTSFTFNEGSLSVDGEFTWLPGC